MMPTVTRSVTKCVESRLAVIGQDVEQRLGGDLRVQCVCRGQLSQRPRDLDQDVVGVADVDRLERLVHDAHVKLEPGVLDAPLEPVEVLEGVHVERDVLAEIE